jgi:hypothetical protein
MYTLKLLDLPAKSVREALAKAAPKLAHVQIPDKIGFLVEGEFDDKLKTEGKDLGLPLVLQKMTDLAQGVQADFIKRTATYLKKADDALAAKPDLLAKAGVLEKTQTQVEAIIKVDRDRAQEEALAAIADYWAELRKKPGRYTAYKLKLGAKIFLAAAGLGVSAGLIGAGVATVGVSSIAGVVGMAKSAITLVSSLISAHEQVETAQKRLEGALLKIKAGFEKTPKLFDQNKKTLEADKKKALGKVEIAEEAGMMVFTQVTGLSGPSAVWPSIKEAKDQLQTVESKLDGVQLEAGKLAKHLEATLKAVEGARKKFLADAEDPIRQQKKADGNFDDKRARKAIADRLDAELTPLEKRVDAAWKATSTVVARAQEAEKKLTASRASVDKLAALKSGKSWTVFENALPLLDVALGLTNYGVFASGSEAAMEFGQSGGALAADKITKRIWDGTWWE